MTYICECGKEFQKPNSFNGHKSHCKIHLEKTGRLEIREQVDFLNRTKISNSLSKRSEDKRIKELSQWISEKHICEKCGKVMTEKFGSGRFCSRACSNSRAKTEEIKNKISKTLINSKKKQESSVKRHNQCIELYLNNPKRCNICNSIIPYEIRNRDTCGQSSCLQEAYSISGRKSVSSQTNIKRSKNEILFYELCVQHFNHVSNNSAIFDGWDADVIIHDYKIAVLWNGIWHYKKITQKHSVEQVRNRDKIKVNKIVENGYIPYIIKDMGQYNEAFVKEEFKKFLDYVDNL